MPVQPTELPESNVVLFALLILGAFLGLFVFFLIGWRLSHGKAALSPYTGQPLRRGEDLSYYSMERVLRYLYSLRDYHNQIFTFRRSAFCRETGRIFPNCINRFGFMRVDWSFLQQRYPGTFVSWGSLSSEQQAAIRDMHDSLEGFQTEHSSTQSQPKSVEPAYAFMKPGPLYVDINSFVLVGWKNVPDTNLEVLMVQRPRSAQPIHFTLIPED